MKLANLKGVRLWGMDFEVAGLDPADLWGTMMPDGTMLKGKYSPEGPTYEEWLVGIQEIKIDPQVVAEIEELTDFIDPYSITTIEDINYSLFGDDQTVAEMNEAISQATTEEE